MQDCLVLLMGLFSQFICHICSLHLVGLRLSHHTLGRRNVHVDVNMWDILLFTLTTLLQHTH